MKRPSELARRAERKKIARKLERHDARPAFPPPDPSLPIGTDAIPEIKHIIVLMMENHSFDNYLGMLDRPDVDGFNRVSGTRSHSNPDKRNNPVELTPRAGPTQVAGVPTQSWRGSHLQWNAGKNDGFVRSVEEMLAGKNAEHENIAMQYWTGHELPFYYGLAKTFPVADRWFSSCLGPTFPNRRFLIAGTAHGLIDDLPFGMLDVPKGGTILDLLTLHEKHWANYHSGPKIRIELGRLLGPMQRLFRTARMIFAGILPRTVGRFFSDLQFTADLYPLKFWSVHNHVRSMKQFFQDAASGHLPAVSIVDPDFGSSSEENPQDIQIGEGFAAAVIQAVMDGKGWRDSLLIWTYDEHGGYYDHVQPPEVVAPDTVPPRSILSAPAPIRWLVKALGKWEKLRLADDWSATYERYGFRVPTVIVSPYAKPNFVTHTVYDHTSILKFIERKWNLPSLTARDHGAKDFMEALDFTHAGHFAVPPSLPSPKQPWDFKERRRARRKRAV